MDGVRETAQNADGDDRHEVLTMFTTGHAPKESDHPHPVRRRRGTLGQGTVELAFAVPIFILMITGIVEYGRALMIQHTMTNAAREGARLAAVTGSESGSVEEAVNYFLQHGGLNVSDAQVSISGSNASTGSNCSVSITYPYRSIVLRLIHFSSDSVNLSVNSTMLHE